MHLSHNGTTQLTRYYIGGQYELDSETGTERLYLGGDAYSAASVYVKEAGNWKIYYICRDYLGSITHVVNADGSLKQELSYDPWGRLRNPATQQIYAVGSEPILFLGRGYTGHEHLTVFGLINMNARLYDPTVGRFLSPDPYVQETDFSQNFNRYSYCLNNPLRYSDPSGELFKALLHWLFYTDSGYEFQKVFSPIAFHKVDIEGSDVNGTGYEISWGVPKLIPISYRKHASNVTYTSYYDGSVVGEVKHTGGEWAANFYVFGVPASLTFAGTTFQGGGLPDQTTNMITFGNPFVNIKYENDYMGIDLPGVPKGNSDSYRTVALQINVGPFRAGMNLFTGKPGINNPPYDSNQEDLGSGHKTYVENSTGNPDQYRAGIFYVGFGSKRRGINSEKLRALVQNGIHFFTGDPFFHKLNRPTTSYWYNGYSSGTTLW